MQFRTEIPIVKSDFPIDYQSQIFSLGSCFAENIGEKFDYFKFRSVVNPFGIIFNPVSLEKIISRSVLKEYFTEDDIFRHNGLWHCFEVHSELSDPNKELFLKTLNELVESTHQQIKNTAHFIITLGTAWVYKEADSGEIVANCHKVPQKQFGKELLSVKIIEQSLVKLISLVVSVNPDACFIFTVSPVRHIKDGFVENNVSKSHLISGVYNVVGQSANVNYFPSYEIMMDELRDYRFYAEDMLHPNPIAIDYIWSRFSENYINPNEFAVMEKVSDIQKSMNHRPFNPDSDSHRKFLENLSQKINTLAIDYPFMKF